MSFDLAGLERAVAAHGPVCRVVIVDIKGSTPRDVGTAMLVWPGGQSGTIGGGRLEYDAAAMARKNLDREIPHSAKTFALGPALGQCCGGAVTLSFERFLPDQLPQDFPHAHPVMAHPGRPEAVDRAIAAGVEAPLHIADWFIEPLAQPQQSLWLYGAGHVGRALANIMAPLPDFALTWIDTGPERFPDPLPDGVTALPAAKPELVVRHAPAEAHHLIMTYAHEMDFALCHAVLSQPFQSCGFIGSATKKARFRSRLSDLGHSDAQISRIACPIGDPNLGKHPQAIAVGVAAELLNGQMLKDSAPTHLRTGRRA
ncbi:xanthine dehydrogenase accessory protein XdhC [Roseobacter sp. HKCCD9010]|uniref:xanthine dehydrogenase accessory protein XdhC n=1 Tax=unclassified Roseobacter TaxID=196798 RepID=UPI001492E4CD|nr:MULTISPECIES: xanthine dehydrogenase accessory protein XdhC [unclassified Roseobacter]MBF9049092.1 xanthine dehydrogenase accessory protein XdhC [Rhodobacterales bacterium HKCCD4356]NNV11092.1 xanthine dehydrogenase accessory protein XdhC [Roseobacter sp. HKCCD7357]NNV15276.1 xanthine dehydrogenase accessory protein XdhC [Roseobacter sp. HKCCD8768]NNV24736.1 xanthine dehydrogenase accessory protein XdhC [Roseobacter sp. HKCCD8192]NNV28992.1 xanthine dehydrogenase accessory protein XdhC [Ros